MTALENTGTEARQDDPPALSQESLDFILDYTKDAPERQLADIDQLDSKVAQTLAAASLVIGLAALVPGGEHPSRSVTALLIAAVCCYAIAAVAALLSLQFQSFNRALSADVLWREHWFRDVRALKHMLVDQIGKAYSANKRSIARKVWGGRVCIIATTLEVVCVGVALIASRS